MKNVLLILIILVSYVPSSVSQVVPRNGQNYRITYPAPTQGIKNGWYQATVKYFNSNTYTRSTYTLNVEVEYNRVVKIDFGNGGSVHSGYNNSDYYYSGGQLMFQYDYNRNIIGATTRVTVQKGNAYLTYDIELE